MPIYVQSLPFVVEVIYPINVCSFSGINFYYLLGKGVGRFIGILIRNLEALVVNILVMLVIYEVILTYLLLFVLV